MKLTVRQLKQLVRESVEEMHLGDDDMDHHEMHHDDMDHHEMHHGEHGDDYSHEEDMEDLIDQHGHEADEAGRGFMQDEEDFPPRSGSGMGRGGNLAESLKLVIREVIEECGCALEEEAVVEELMEKKMGFKKLTKSLAAKGAKNPKGLAYWIGKKKFGKAEMTKRAVEGKKKASK